MLRLDEILEPVESKVDDLGLAQGRGRRVMRFRRDEHLAAVAGGGDACDSIQVHAHVVVAVPLGPAGVQPHADAHLSVRRPGRGPECALRSDRPADRVIGSAESEEMRVALAPELPAVDLFDSGAQQR